MSDRYTNLAQLVGRRHVAAVAPGEEVIEVSVPVSTAAALYERVRNTLDYQEEHLLRRNAILRILKRYLGTDVSLASLAGDLLKELVWAQYLPNRAIPVSLVNKLEPVIAKYEALLQTAERAKAQREVAFNWVLDVLATEIETIVSPVPDEEALAAFMYDEVRRRTDWDPRLPIKEEDKDLRLYIAVHRSLLKSNPATLGYRVLTLYYPDWPGAANPELIEEVAKNLLKIIEAVEREIKDPLTDRLSRMLRRRAGIFRVLGDALRDLIDKDPEGIADPDTLDTAVRHALEVRTANFRVRLRRTVVRAVVFLFITKMFLALLLELPYDLLILGSEAHFYPLLINIIFPPLFLALISLTVVINNKKNSEDYVNAIRAVGIGADHPILHLRVKHLVRSSWQLIFDGLYVLLFVAVYGAIAFGLMSIGFHWLSIALFLFFLSLVTFFGIRIRQSTREIIASDARSGLVGTVFDILLLPIVRAGAWMSNKISRINVFIYFFDFIIEAPLKVAIEFIEGWLSFIREKKEEI